METKLYPGIAFSPQAVLTDSIGAADTIIPVSDVSAFPDAPNLATIGVDEEGETVFYTAKTDAVLSGCVRGVEGTAKAWFKGELIARNWTAKDHGDLIAAVGEAVTAAKTAAEAVAAHAGDSAAHEDIRAAARDALEYHQEAGDAHKELFAAKQNKLTGTPGQVVGFGADGGAQVVQGWSNPNLLDNWYFGDPVNQRGQTEYMNNYTVDRWKIGNGTVSLVDGHIVVQHSSGTLCVMQQLNQELYKGVSGKIVTISLLLSDGLLSATGIVPDGDDNQEYRVTGATGFECEICLYKSGPRKDIAWQILLREQNSVSLIAAKLELGPVQTLAHQDADGSWVLNDPPPNKALELAKCRSFYRLCGAGLSATIQNGKPLFTFPFDAEMRANPTVGLLVKDLVFRLGMMDYKFTDASISGQYCIKGGAVFILLSGSFDKTPPPDGAMLRINLDANIFSVDANL